MVASRKKKKKRFDKKRIKGRKRERKKTLRSTRPFFWTGR
jgi:hypothetical protein